MEITNIEAFERAFGKHLHACPWASRLKDMQRFNSATIGERIARGGAKEVPEEYEAFLKNIAKSKDDPIKLPIVGYFRTSDVPVNMEDFKPIKAELFNQLAYDVWSIGDVYAAGDIKKVDDTAYISQLDNNTGYDPTVDDGTWWKVFNSEKEFQVRYQNRTATVNVLAIAHGRGLADEVALPLEIYLQENRVINIPCRMFRGLPNDTEDRINTVAVFNLPAIIKEPDNISFNDVTVKKDGITQLYAKLATYEVNLPFLSGDQVAPVDIEVEMMPIMAGWKETKMDIQDE